MNEQLIILLQIIFIDLVLAGDNAVIIGMVASQFEADKRKKIIFWGIGAAVILRIIFTLIASYLLQIDGLRLIGGLLLLYIVYKLYIDVIKDQGKPEDIKVDKSSLFISEKFNPRSSAKLSFKIINSGDLTGVGIVFERK